MRYLASMQHAVVVDQEHVTRLHPTEGKKIRKVRERERE
jgi:hypothetical protein